MNKMNASAPEKRVYAINSKGQARIEKPDRQQSSEQDGDARRRGGMQETLRDHRAGDRKPASADPDQS